MKVYVIRHGESEANVDNLWSGWWDTHLTEKGIVDAKKTGEFLKGVFLTRYIQATLNAL